VNFTVFIFLLKKFVDGWELNGEYFPGIHDHELSLDHRINEFCDKTFSFTRKVNRKRKFISHQNAAVFQYKIPIQGAFAITVRYHHNPKREYSIRPALILRLNWIPRRNSLQYSGRGRGAILRSPELRNKSELHFVGLVSGSDFN
jgi:Corticotropin-releasing factor binding protein (CRF-BP)